MNLVIANPPRRTRKRRWGSPAQRAALKRMLAANPRRKKSHRRTRRRSIVRTNPGGSTVAKRRKSPRRRSVRRSIRRTYRKARRSVGRGGMLSKYLPPGGLVAIAGGVGGFLGTQYALAKLPLPAQLQTGNGRIAAKVLIGIVGRMVLKRANPSIANAFAVGAFTSAGLDIAGKAMGAAGMPALSGYTPGGGVSYQLLPGDGQDPSLGDAGDLSGLYAESMGS